MTPERWQLVKNLFELALQQKPGQRSTYLAKACASDPGLQSEVECLLSSHEQANSFIEVPALEAHAELFPSELEQSLAGRRIGPYQLMSEIGRGGMGTVYLAARADDQYQRQVAIKLVSRGMDTDTILLRFRKERQILANLDHPNIARLFDGVVSARRIPKTQVSHRTVDSFVSGSNAIPAAGNATLAAALADLNANANSTILIEGFADNVGSAADNVVTSRNRAATAQAFFIANGIAANRIAIVGRGETNFVATNDNEAGRRQNRRIEMTVHRP